MYVHIIDTKRSVALLGPDAALARLAISDDKKRNNNNSLWANTYAIKLLTILDKLQSSHVLDPTLSISLSHDSDSEVSRYAKALCLSKNVACFEALVCYCYYYYCYYYYY